MGKGLTGIRSLQRKHLPDMQDWINGANLTAVNSHSRQTCTECGGQDTGSHLRTGLLYKQLWIPSELKRPYSNQRLKQRAELWRLLLHRRSRHQRILPKHQPHLAHQDAGTADR
jgi:hypothetical protein